MIEVILRYKRVDGDRSTGHLHTHVDGPSPVDVVLLRFESVDFSTMMYAFAKALQDYPDAQAVVQRTDRPGLVPYNLETNLADLFRTDPVTAVASMSTPYGSPSNTIERVKKEQEPIAFGGLRVGYDTLVDSFGDILYTNYDAEKTRIECPCCGIWNPFSTEFVCVNPKCAKPLEIEEAAGRRMGFSTRLLLDTHSARYYFPRAWNNYKPWVTWEALNEKYEQFKKEKASCP